MTFGDFVFSLDTLAFQELSRKTSWAWASNPVMGDLDDGQFTGQRDDVINLAGDLVPQVAGKASSLDRLRAIGKEGKPRVLVGGDGVVFGPYALASLDERRSALWGDGTARRYDFSAEFRRQRDDAMLDPDANDQVKVDKDGFDVDLGDPVEVDLGDEL